MVSNENWDIEMKPVSINNIAQSITLPNKDAHQVNVEESIETID